MNQNFNTPILFLIFNRPDTTQQVFDVIRQVRPKQLFIAADGPRHNKTGEEEKCESTRAIIKQVDWDCEVKTLFRGENLGCGRSISRAITWFFENVEEGIILEDDCLPDLSFFPFCANLLERYRFDDRIFMISGDNFLPESLRLKGSYYFSRIPHTWGWATWRHAWEKYSFKMDDLPVFIKDRVIEKIWSDKKAQNYWLERFKEVYKGHLDTWDYQWVYDIWKNNGLSIAPNINLVSNIGFDDRGTHTFNKNDILANIPSEEILFPLITDSCDIYNLGDDYENKQLYTQIYVYGFYGFKKLLKTIGLFKPIKNIYQRTMQFYTKFTIKR